MKTNTTAKMLKAVMMAFGLVFLGLALPACGTDADGHGDVFHLSLEEEAADAVETEGYCERAEAAAKANPKKIAICHIPPGNPANAHTIVVSRKAKKAHLAHGDILGPCGCDGDDTPNDGGDSSTPGNGGGDSTTPGDDEHGHDHGDHGDDGDDSHDDDHGDDGDGSNDGADSQGGATTTGSDADAGNGTTGGDDSGMTSAGGYGNSGAGTGSTDGAGTTSVDGTTDSGTGDTGADGGYSTGGGETGYGDVCDADQVTCSEDNDCPMNNVCDLGCCVYVIL